jgi:membrane peptidoglycan carboxypeptidase
LDARYITASTQLKDEAIKFGDYEPRNYDGKFRGKVLVRYALANSLNIPAVHVMELVGIKDGIKMAESLGITSLKNEDDYGLSLVLGAAEVPLIEMTNAYATFANQGTWNKYQIFLEVHDRNGKVILKNQPESRRALSSAVSYLISSILSDNKARADAFGGALSMSRTAAVKTGTTNDYKDSLTLGYTPQVAVGVWIGNNDNKAMNSVAGSIGAAPIWRQIMEAYLKDKPVENFAKPSAIEEEKVCREDGLKIDTATDSAFVEYFIRGTKPTKMCSIIPTITPTKTEDQLKKEEEEKKKREEEEKKKNETPTPAPSNTSAPSPTSAASPTPLPTSGNTPTPIISLTPTDVLPSITP